MAIASNSRLLIAVGAVFVLLILAAAAFVITSRGGGEAPVGGEATGTTTPPQATGEETTTPAAYETTTSVATTEQARPISVLVLFDVGGRGDLSFNDMAALGADRAAEELGVDVVFQTPQSLAVMESVLDAASRSGEYDLIVLVGFLWQEPLEKVAPRYPEQKYALIDAATRERYDNVASYLFREQEVASLVGIIAADIANNISKATGEEAKAGAVAGMDIPPLWRFHIGYLYGVQYYNQAMGTDVEMVWTYTGRFDDPTLGKTTAEQMLQQGVRVFYGVAGLTHVGMFNAVKEAAARGVIAFSIGQDASQEWYDPQTIIISGLKRVDVAVYTAIKDVVEGRFRGGIVSLGLKEGGLGLSDEEIIRYFAEIAAETGQLPEGLTPEKVVEIVMSQREKWISNDGWRLVEELKQKIISGEIKFVTPQDHDTYDSIIEELKAGNLEAALES
ncbi:membrane lipoprotein family protein [Aeropyrum pernix K1]|uniref:Membrane lipoprotein family protein n=2 Tax=Aeropyrum pernix (strain ATCC 700893 / DSM 11879 / JCM 9820 / NBRC 100138 / K1) TaxID=272557 RepID=Q9Y8P1_AERPE|nr:BMP family ABC transporter substrate-binding protein [Aeropyrum pernix]BAA81609.2 membrane lipoprotein family protein [Aeropyrum pernix K1]